MSLPPAPSKAARAYLALRDRIITLRLRPGAQLAERAICAEMGISRTPYREAVTRLAQEGLVIVVPSDATFVNRIVMRNVTVGHFMRANLEVPVAALAAQRAGADDLLALDHVARAMIRSARSRDADMSFALDRSFHRLLFAAAGMEDAWHVLHGATGQLDRLRRWAFPHEPAFFDQTLSEHLAILAAVRQGEVDTARILMRAHLDDTMTVPHRMVASDPDIIEIAPEDLQSFASVIRSA